MMEFHLKFFMLFQLSVLKVKVKFPSRFRNKRWLELICLKHNLKKDNLKLLLTLKLKSNRFVFFLFPLAETSPLTQTTSSTKTMGGRRQCGQHGKT